MGKFTDPENGMKFTRGYRKGNIELFLALEFPFGMMRTF